VLQSNHPSQAFKEPPQQENQLGIVAVPIKGSISSSIIWGIFYHLYMHTELAAAQQKTWKRGDKKRVESL